MNLNNGSVVQCMGFGRVNLAAHLTGRDSGTLA